VIGGAGTLLGPIYGGLVVIGLPETLRAMAQWRPSFIGAVLVAVIILSPGGVSRGLQMLGVLIGKRRETYKAADSLAKRGKG
jgi:ABC-type branched-subunit amino acid transport system permease subunit